MAAVATNGILGHRRDRRARTGGRSRPPGKSGRCGYQSPGARHQLGACCRARAMLRRLTTGSVFDEGMKSSAEPSSGQSICLFDHEELADPQACMIPNQRAARHRAGSADRRNRPPGTRSAWHPDLGLSTAPRRKGAVCPLRGATGPTHALQGRGHHRMAGRQCIGGQTAERLDAGQAGDPSAPAITPCLLLPHLMGWGRLASG